MIDPGVVRRWFQDEGIFAGDVPKQESVAQWLLRVPIDPQQTINLHALVPKAKPDLLVLMLSVVPNQEFQQTLASLTDGDRERFVRMLIRRFIENLGMVPSVGLGPDQRFVITFGVNCYADAPLTKNLVMEGIRRLTRTFFYFELTAEEMFRQFGNESELLRP